MDVRPKITVHIPTKQLVSRRVAGDALETFSILGVMAGATERLRLVTSVLVLPYRNPVLTAKVASLDVLSGGRLTLGVGAGWLRGEFEALNSPAFNAWPDPTRLAHG